MRGNIDILDKNGKHLTVEQLKEHMKLSGPTELDMPTTADGQNAQVDDCDAVFNIASNKNVEKKNKTPEKIKGVSKHKRHDSH